MARINNWDNRSEIIALAWALFDKQDRFKGKCEMCGADLPREKAILHHTKYEGATIKDILIVDQKCNMQPENKNLV